MSNFIVPIWFGLCVIALIWGLLQIRMEWQQYKRNKKSAIKPRNHYDTLFKVFLSIIRGGK